MPVCCSACWVHIDAAGLVCPSTAARLKRLLGAIVIVGGLATIQFAFVGLIKRADQGVIDNTRTEMTLTTINAGKAFAPMGRDWGHSGSLSAVRGEGRQFGQHLDQSCPQRLRRAMDGNGYPGCLTWGFSGYCF